MGVYTHFGCDQMTNIREHLAANIRTLRNELKMTQGKLAELAETSTRYIQQIEGGQKYPSPEILEQIAFALKKDTLDLFGVLIPQEIWKKKILTEIECVIQKNLLELGNKSENKEN
jgi:transcriptional regulator with XRE-family HTH domain